MMHVHQRSFRSVLYSRAPLDTCCYFQFKFNKMYNLSVTLVTFQVLSSHMWQVRVLSGMAEYFTGQSTLDIEI